MRTFIELDDTLLTHDTYIENKLYLTDIEYDMLKHFTEIDADSVEETVDAYVDMLELFISEAKLDAISCITTSSIRRARACTYLIELETQIRDSLIHNKYDAQLLFNSTIYIKIHE